MLWCCAVPTDLWTKPLDFIQHATDNGELRTPFIRYVQLESIHSSGESFTRFLDLPLELRLRILGFCDTPTLFQLMHTSSHTRTEARKLFFGNPEAQYCIDADWLLEGGYPGVVLDDMGFLVHVTRLDVGFHRMTHKTWMRPQDYLEWEDTEEKAVEDMAGGMEGQIDVFWRTLQRRFPNARDVTLSEEHARKPDEWPPQIFWKVAQLCPLDMKVSVAVLHGDRSFECRLDRCVWQQIDSIDGRWEKISTPARSLILMPLKAFRGPVGAYQALWRKNMDVFEQKRAAEILLIAAIEQHHFQARHEPFRCFAPGCDVWFHRPNEFTTHVIQTGHSEHAVPPQPFEALFAANKERLRKMLQDARTVQRSIEEEWGEYGSEERRVAELAYLEQLECDPVYAQGKPAELSVWWSAIHINL